MKSLLLILFFCLFIPKSCYKNEGMISNDSFNELLSNIIQDDKFICSDNVLAYITIQNKQERDTLLSSEIPLLKENFEIKSKKYCRDNPCLSLSLSIDNRKKKYYRLYRTCSYMKIKLTTSELNTFEFLFEKENNKWLFIKKYDMN